MSTAPTPISMYNFNNEELSLVLRNIGQFENLSVVSLLKKFQDSEEASHHATNVSAVKGKGNSKSKSKSKGKGKGKKTVLKKRDIIRQKNAEKKATKLQNEDLVKLRRYQRVSKVSEKTISDIKYFKTDYGKARMKYPLMKYAYEQHDFELLLELFCKSFTWTPALTLKKEYVGRSANLCSSKITKKYSLSTYIIAYLRWISTTITKKN